jgi:predicted Zn-dependent protease
MKWFEENLPMRLYAASLSGKISPWPGAGEARHKHLDRVNGWFMLGCRAGSCPEARPDMTWRGFFLLLALLAAAAASSGCSTVPYTGRSQFNIVGSKEEIALGQRASQQVLREEKISRDPALNAAVNRVGRAIASVASMPDARWEFHVIDKNVPNAFCLPGGIIYVYSGLFRYARNDDQLAAVIGHEVAHALARHGAERMSQQLAIALPGVAVGAVLGAQSPILAQTFSRVYGIGAQVGVALPHGRSQEYEADRIGLILMAKAGYDPGGAVTFWRNMMAAGGGRTPDFLSTHPANENRIEQITKLLPEARSYSPHYAGQGGKPVPPPDDDPPPGVER